MNWIYNKLIENLSIEFLEMLNENHLDVNISGYV